MKLFPAELSDLLTLVHTKHFNQWRKNGVPYLIHPLDVARRLAEWGISPDDYPNMHAAAYCHDLLEDTDATAGLIESWSNDSVASIVQELTFRGRLDGEPSLAYQRAKSEHLASFSGKSVESLVLKVADRICNTRDFHASGQLAYAEKYWGYASGLFAAMKARMPEIERAFGDKVAHLMRRDFEVYDERLDP